MLFVLSVIVVLQYSVIYKQQKRIAYLLDVIRRFSYFENTQERD